MNTNNYWNNIARLHSMWLSWFKLAKQLFLQNRINQLIRFIMTSMWTTWCGQAVESMRPTWCYESFTAAHIFPMLQLWLHLALSLHYHSRAGAVTWLLAFFSQKSVQSCWFCTKIRLQLTWWRLCRLSFLDSPPFQTADKSVDLMLVLCSARHSALNCHVWCAQRSPNHHLGAV